MKWHYDVHHRLGEQLVYYLLRVRPYDAHEVREKLRHLLNKYRLESVRVFKIFGANDLLIRAWLHSQVMPEFPEYLKKALPQEISITTFTVTGVHAIASAAPQIDVANASHLLDILHDDATLRAVQLGQDSPLLNNLIKEKIILTRDRKGPIPIKFYIAVHLAEDADRIHADAARKIYDHINENMPTVGKLSVYRGMGFCQILLKGEVVGSNFFSIGELIDWVYTELAPYKASTETYVVAWPIPVVETPDTISEATFRAIAGKNLLVNIVLPEVYDDYFSERRNIEIFFSNTSSQTILRYRQLVREYLLGYLQQKNAEMGRVLYIFFSELEEYLREAHREFIGKSGLVVNSIYDSVAIPADSRKYIVLGQLFNIYAYVIRAGQLPTGTNLAGDWNKLVELRNKQMHGNLNSKEEWARCLGVVIEALPRIAELLNIIFKTTGKEYQFTYFQVPPQ